MSERMPEANEDDNNRFEDLTVDDDLPIIDRIVRYSSSQIALQRLVHVKMIAETAELAGADISQRFLIPLVETLLKDEETVIRQHVAAQILPLSIVCMVNPSGMRASDFIENPDHPKEYNETGYRLVTTRVLTCLNTLVSDTDIDVRRAAADSLSGLALQIRPEDVPAFCLPIPLRLALQKPTNLGGKQKPPANEQQLEELRITAANLLAEIGGVASEHKTLKAQASWVRTEILPAILDLCKDQSFRVRRSATQALPRILGACSLEDAESKILPAFSELSQDELHRVRKSAGECLVDMSRALMILAASEENSQRKLKLYEFRRRWLLPIADRLIQDPHKMVRQGMMQFLGPFIASFYPYQYSALHSLLPASTESDGSNHVGIVAQFFPHATSMVSRLNSSQNAVQSAPTPVHGSVASLFPRELTDLDRLQQTLPQFIHASRLSALSLAAVATHRNENPPHREDINAIVDTLLDFFAALAVVATGDENTDAEMRVYCAYSFPAVVLLLGPENWGGSIRTCFHTLLNPNYGQDDEGDNAAEPPLPVKRCLASSLHTVAHILGPEITAADIMPVVQDFFLKDSDDSVRLNMLRNFPVLLQLLPPEKRKDPFVIWSEVVLGEEVLGAKKRSVTNPIVLNWRQRDYLARSIPELLGLIDPLLLHQHLWPILKQLMKDTVNIVRDDAMWSIPILLKVYCPDTVSKWPQIQDARGFSAKSSADVVTWLKEAILHIGGNGAPVKPTSFGDRQLYCRVCGGIGLALRLNEELSGDDGKKDPVSVLSAKFKSLFFRAESNESETGPYKRITSAEQKHLRRILLEDLIPAALEMKEDRISNVRVTLMKVLQLMPKDIKPTPKVAAVLKALVEEAQTWESFGGYDEFEGSQDLAAASSEPLSFVSTSPKASSNPDSFSGPVDVDAVVITPQSSRDDQDMIDAEKDEPDGNMNDAADEYMDAEQGVVDGPGDSAPEVPSPNVAEDADENIEDTLQAEKVNVSPDNLGEVTNQTAADIVTSQEKVPAEKPAEVEREKPVDDDGEALRVIMFEDGPIGMQLEPTADDRACRIYAFVDSPDGRPSPARSSGKVELGDVIVKVNNVVVKSYDETIAILKGGGRREIALRRGRPEDVCEEDDEDDDEEGAKKSKKSKKESKKEKKPKKEKKKKSSKEKD